MTGYITLPQFNYLLCPEVVFLWLKQGTIWSSTSLNHQALPAHRPDADLDQSTPQIFAGMVQASVLAETLCNYTSQISAPTSNSFGSCLWLFK